MAGKRSHRDARITVEKFLVTADVPQSVKTILLRLDRGKWDTRQGWERRAAELKEGQ